VTIASLLMDEWSLGLQMCTGWLQEHLCEVGKPERTGSIIGLLEVQWCILTWS